MNIFLLLFLTLFVNHSFSQEKISISCSDFKGTTLDYQNGEAISSKDGYAGQTIKFTFPVPPKLGGIVDITWTGRNNRNLQGVILGNSPDGWVSFIHSDKHVVRTFIFYFNAGAVAMTESQASVMLSTPQVRSFFSRCVDS